MTHPFLKQFLHLLGITYQQPIRKKDNKYYDLLFDKIDIVLEVQENADNHDDKDSDYTKEALVLLRDKRIYYFHIKLFQENNYQYLNDFWHGYKKEIKSESGKK
jgi:hypothetical protein